MSKKLLKREITDAVDILLEGVDVLEQGDIQDIEIDLLKAYHDHPFTLYTGKRLEDMVDSIRENGILNPIIVLKKEDGAYEILSGHNRVNAARLADLKTVQCIVKEHLSEEEAYTYVIETNLMQRSFSDLLPTEKALVLKVRYEKIASQGKRNDLQKEINNLDRGIIEKESKAEDKTDSRKSLGKEYHLSGASRSISRKGFSLVTLDVRIWVNRNRSSSLLSMQLKSHVSGRCFLLMDRLPRILEQWSQCRLKKRTCCG